MFDSYLIIGACAELLPYYGELGWTVDSYFIVGSYAELLPHYGELCWTPTSLLGAMLDSDLIVPVRALPRPLSWLKGTGVSITSVEGIVKHGKSLQMNC